MLHVDDPSPSGLPAKEVAEWAATLPFGATVQAVLGTTGHQRDETTFLAGLTATWSEVRS